MNKIIILTTIVLIAGAGCAGTSRADASQKKEKRQSIGIKLENMDLSVKPGTDFYQYANGGWMKNNPLTPEYARFGTFEKLAEDNREQLKNLIEELAAKRRKHGTIPQKIGDLYNMAMDKAKLNDDGVKPVAQDLASIDAIKNKNQIAGFLGGLQRYGINAYWQIFVDSDPMNSKMNMFQTYQGGLGMGQRDYYLETDKSTANIRAKYKEHIAKMFKLFGYGAAQAKKAVNSVMEIETRLAKAAYPKEKLRDPHANYHKTDINALKAQYSNFDWNAYFEALAATPANVNISQPESVKEAIEIIKNYPLENQKLYVKWHIMLASARYLSDAVVDQNFDFYGKTMSGKQEKLPRWKEAVDTINGSMGEALGQMYVKKYFPPAAKKRMIKLVKNLQIALGERIDNLSWMSDETKKKAREKLATFYVKIGYPDKWRDYSALEIGKDSYWANYKRAAKFEMDYQLSQTDKPVDKDKWYMTPQTVNAYYNPSTNEICFPAGILQYPFFDMKADDAFNYGAIGVVIGHEMTHGFDDQGRQYDKDGNLKDWWTKEDASNFKKRADVMAKFFDNILVAPGVHANGRFTLGENIADYGGLQVSFQAFKNATKNKPLAVKEGFTPEQRFFLAYGALWAANIRPEEILRRTKVDPHSLGEWRVNGALPQISSWYDAFGITSKDPMYVAPKKRVSIW